MAASYPTSVKIFTTKSAGETIDAAHINDAQDEINAIEAGLLNGTAPLNSSGSTLATLSVTGNSTLVNVFISKSTITDLTATNSTLTNLVATNSTLTNAQIANSTFSVRPVAPPPDAVRLVLSSVVDLTNGSTLVVSWSTALIATNSSMHSTTTNRERVTPQSTGVYAFHASITFSQALASGSTEVGLVVVEDSSGTALVTQFTVGDDGTAPVVSVSGLKRFDSVAGSTQWLRVVTTVREGSTNSVAASGQVTTFDVYKL